MTTKKILLNEDKFVGNIKNSITQNSSNLETAKQELSSKCNEALSQAKAYTDQEKAKYLPLTSGTVTDDVAINGALTMPNGLIRTNDTSKSINIRCTTDDKSGAKIVLNGKDAANNTVKSLKIEQLNTLLNECALNSQNLYLQKWKYKEQIENVQTKEELKTIEFKFTMKDFS